MLRALGLTRTLTPRTVLPRVSAAPLAHRMLSHTIPRPLFSKKTPPPKNPEPATRPTRADPKAPATTAAPSDAKATPIAPATTMAAAQNLGLTPQEEAKLNSHPILKRVPKFARKYCVRFIDAPFSHVTAFIVLHELTAIVPLIGIWWVLHKYQVHVPLDLPTWAVDKGTAIIDKLLESFDFTKFTLNDKFRLIMEGGYAYVIVKFLLPLRLVVSLGLMPWFARVFVLPITGLFKRKKKPAKGAVDAPADVKIKKVTKPRL